MTRICLHLRTSGALLALLALPALAMAAPPPAQLPGQDLSSSVAVTVPLASAGAPGDLVSYDPSSGTYRLSHGTDDPDVIGVVVADPPIVLFSEASGTPVARTGSVPVNVSLENGAIKPGDGIIASSADGIGMRANASSAHIIGTAAQAFDGAQAAQSASASGRSFPEGSIAVALSGGTGQGGTGGSAGIPCTAGATACAVLAKINAAPLVSLVRYLLAAALAFGSLFIAFRIFVANAINGIVSIGRNPRAKGAIQAMIILNVLLAAFILIVGVGSGVAILLIQA